VTAELPWARLDDLDADDPYADLPLPLLDEPYLE
jgi:hypothetical protein